jgi:hypothetical protein
MHVIRCKTAFPNGPRVGGILRRGNHTYEYVSADTKDVITIPSKIFDTSPYFTRVEWLVHSFKNTNNGNIYTLDIKDFKYHSNASRSGAVMTLETCAKRYEIHSVLRLADGEVFERGKHACYTDVEYKINSSPREIRDFKVVDDTVFIQFVNNGKWFDDFMGYCVPYVINFTTVDGVSKTASDTWYYIGKPDIDNNFKGVLKYGPTKITDGISDQEGLRFHDKGAAMQYAKQHRKFSISRYDFECFLKGQLIEGNLLNELFIKFFDEREHTNNN